MSPCLGFCLVFVCLFVCLLLLFYARARAKSTQNLNIADMLSNANILPSTGHENNTAQPKIALSSPSHFFIVFFFFFFLPCSCF